VIVIVDAHLHCSGRETTGEVLRSLDDAAVDVAILLAPFLTEPYTLDDPATLIRANLYLSALVKGHEDRLIGFAVVNPRSPRAIDDAARSLDLPGIRGLKLVPAGWYPYDQCAHAVYEVASSRRAPILFHSGIFIDGRSGRYCRPTFFEAVRDHPALKVALAHLGWPWTDEANAVGIIDLINGVAPDDAVFRFDLSFGAPPVYRQDVIRRAVACLTPSLLQFGSDRFLPCSGAHIASAITETRELCMAAGCSSADIARILGGTAAKWLGIEQRG
jgi:predicted TIM-barrel fold metal-dependent hydrolase